MSDYVIYLTAPAYLAEWLTHTFGDPVILIKESPESRIMNELLVKLPANAKPDMGEGANVRIVIPYFKGKNPEVYNYLHKSGKDALLESFCTLFDKNLWTEVSALENGHVKRKKLIYAFMEKHGIAIDHWDTVAQRFHRLNQKYKFNNNIKVA